MSAGYVGCGDWKGGYGVLFLTVTRVGLRFQTELHTRRLFVNGSSRFRG